jgi:cysteine synthase
MKALSATLTRRALSSISAPMAHTGQQLSAFDQSVGNTRLLRLKGPSDLTGCDIYGKAEYENPGGSIKDRAALWMILDAEARGELVRGQPGIIVEGTAGNTGIGLALAGQAFGYQVVICLADTQSPEKKECLRSAGAQLVEVPAGEYAGRFTCRTGCCPTTAAAPGTRFRPHWLPSFFATHSSD